MDPIAQILYNFFEPSYLSLMLYGTALGVVFGAIPGLNATIGITLMLPFTYRMTPELGIAMLMGVYIGAISGGFISATLVGIPGTNASIATCYDAYPLSQKGETVRALGTGMIGSFLGTILSMIIAMFAVRYLSRIALYLGPWEYFSLCVSAVSLIIALSDDNLFKGLGGAFFGMLLGVVGVSPIDASYRFTFGITNLLSGFDLVGVMLGVFAVKLIGSNYARGLQKMPDMGSAKMHGLGVTWKDVVDNWFNILRSFFLGLWIGFLPGLGGNVSNLIAYGQAKKASKHPEKFGTGCVDGIWASEVSNNSTIGGALVPMLALGVPGDGLTALLMGGLMIHGIETGPLMIVNKPILVYTVFMAGIFAAVYTMFMQLFGMQIFPKILKAPYHFLYASIIFICLTGSFSSGYTLFNCGVTVGFGVLSVLMSYIGVPIAPVILGYILGPLIEKNLRLGLTYSRTGGLEFLTRPVSCIFIIISVVSLVSSLISYRKQQNRKKVYEDED